QKKKKKIDSKNGQELSTLGPGGISSAPLPPLKRFSTTIKDLQNLPPFATFATTAFKPLGDKDCSGGKFSQFFPT
ncbi:MAG: hypothetical protein Q9N34_06855, partial [Aquificota bacterium]|nr:hypothetical protein [Aquificota bacterium]